MTTGKAGGLTDCEPPKAVYSTDLWPDFCGRQIERMELLLIPQLSHLLLIMLVLLLAGCQRNNTAILSSMIGKNIRGDEIQKWLSKVEDSPEISKSDDCFFYSFKQKGISLRFDKAETLTTIFLYSEGADGFRQYQDELPFKLSFVLDRKEIESFLGKPDRSGGEGRINYWVLYTSKGIYINYNSMDTNDLAARIYFLSITNYR